MVADRDSLRRHSQWEDQVMMGERLAIQESLF
jgi:hypothetical protein